ncbi:MAG TPA: tail fiber domain-containing protein [Verrucomicrobiae bacterium]
MRSKLLFSACLVSALGLNLALAAPVGTAFTYQGRLNEGANPASGLYDFSFAAFDAASAGTQSGSTVNLAAVPVSNGLFSVTLDFGSIFDGNARWLAISVKTNGGASYATLSPRQPLTASPYAVFAPTAGSAASANTATMASAAGTAGSFTGPLVGDVTGTQGATVVSSLGGQTTASVASGASAANAATSANTANTIVKRDGTGGFSAGSLTATSLAGEGSGLTALNASALASGTVGDGRLSANVALLDARQTFSGSNRFDGVVIATNTLNVIVGSFTGNGSALSSLNGASLTPGTVGGAALQPNSVTADKVAAGQVVKSLNSLRDDVTLAPGANVTLTPSGQTLTLASPTDWHIGGNAGTTPGTDFLGTTDNQPLTFKVNNYPTLVLGTGNTMAMGGNSASGANAAALGFGNTASGVNAMALGINSIASGGYSRAFGNGATASGVSATAIGSGIAAGDWSTAMGYYSRALHTGTFVWGDFSGAVPFSSTDSNQFLIRATGGVGIGITNPIAALHVVDGSGTNNHSGGHMRIGANAYDGDPKLIQFGDEDYVHIGENVRDDTMELKGGRFFFTHGDYGNGFVGIGTNDPKAALHVVGNVVASNFIGSAAGLTGIPAASLPANVAYLDANETFTGGLTLNGGVIMNSSAYLRGHDLLVASDLYHGLGWYGSGKLFAGYNVDGPALYGFSGGALGTSNGVQKMALHWDTTGNVALDPGNANDGLLAPGLTFGNGSGEGISSKRTAGGNQYGLDFYAGSNPRMSIRQNGRVGIGTQNPAAALQVVGTVIADSFTGSGAGLTGIPAASLPGNIAYLDANQTFSGGLSFNGLLAIYNNVYLNNRDIWLSQDENHGLGWYGGGKLFAGYNVDGPALFGFSGGVLGTMNGGQKMALHWDTTGNVALDPGNLNNGTLTPGLTFGNGSGEGIGSKRTPGGNQSGLDFYTSFVNRMSIANNGNIGIGTLGPVARLDVRDGTGASGNGGHIHVGSTAADGDPKLINFGDGDYVHIGEAGGDDIMHLQAMVFCFTNISGAGRVGLFRYPTANKLELEGNASKTVAGSWLANSDARIKKDVQPVKGALDTLDKVRLVDFQYTDEYRRQHPAIEDHRYLNVVAQEFQQVFPEWVSDSGEKLENGESILQVDTYPLVIYSAAAVQELHQQLKAKDVEIQSLKQRLDAIEKMLARSGAK